MKIPMGLFILGFLVFILGGDGTVYYAQNSQVQAEVDAHLADLRQAKDQLDPIQADLTAALRQMYQVQIQANSPEAVSPQDVKSLQDRIDKDQSDVKILSSQIMEDVSFLKAHWSSLVQADRDYVSLVQVSVM